jgi:hypothetical protein
MVPGRPPRNHRSTRQKETSGWLRLFLKVSLGPSGRFAIYVNKKGPQLPICEFVMTLLFAKYLAKVSS